MGGDSRRHHQRILLGKWRVPHNPCTSRRCSPRTGNQRRRCSSQGDRRRWPSSNPPRGGGAELLRQPVSNPRQHRHTSGLVSAVMQQTSHTHDETTAEVAPPWGPRLVEPLGFRFPFSRCLFYVYGQSQNLVSERGRHNLRKRSLVAVLKCSLARKTPVLLFPGPTPKARALGRCEKQGLGGMV